MKEAFWIYLFMALGIFTIVVMLLLNDLTSTAEEDYYLAKEVLEASMVDSIDLGLYRKTGDIRIIESKFVESFVRRFSESVNDSKEYTIKFYEIYEMPPKATVFISTKSREFKVSIDEQGTYDILTALSGILETKEGVDDDIILPTGSSTAPKNVNYSVKVVCNGCKVSSTTKTVPANSSIYFSIEAASGYVLKGSTYEGNCYMPGDSTVIINGSDGPGTCTINLQKEEKPVTNPTTPSVTPQTPATTCDQTINVYGKKYCCTNQQVSQASSAASSAGNGVYNNCSRQGGEGCSSSASSAASSAYYSYITSKCKAL